MERPALAVITTDVDRHPAVAAWIRTGRGRPVPDRILVLREARRRSVYRLPGVGPDGGAVIAKRTRLPVARIEKIVYEDVLPHLPFTSPGYYGSWFDGPHSWVLLEDVSGEPFRGGEAEHRRLASRWVGALHAGGTGLDAARALPRAGPAQYRDHLTQGRGKIRAAMRRWPFAPGETEVLRALVSRYDAIEAAWDVIEARCRAAPGTVVHGDFQPKNIYVRETRDGLSLRIIDWEMAGFGCPAADLTRIDLDEYWSVVRSRWSEMSIDGVGHLARVGLLFQRLAEVHWLSEWFRSEDGKAHREAVIRLDLLLTNLTDAAAAVLEAQ